MQEKYTKKAFDVLQRAKEAAAKLGNEYIGTEHILLGLTLVQQSVAAKALEGQNVTYHQVMERICAGNVHVPAAGVGRCSTGSMDRGGRDSRAAVGVGVASYYVRQAGRAAFQWA